MKRLFLIIITLILFFLSILTIEAQAATLYLYPSTGTFDIGSNFLIRVMVNGDGVSINAAESRLSFNPEELRVVSISRAGSIFTLWTNEPTFCNSGGMIEFGGGTPTNFTERAGRIISITFRGRKEASANINFVSGAVLAADGRGTNVLDNMQNAIYRIRPAVFSPTPLPPTEEIVTDTEPPELFQIQIDNEGDITNPTPILIFETTDKISGIDFYEIRIDNQEPIRITPAELAIRQFRLPFQRPGNYSVIIRAVDRIGNYSIAIKDFTIETIKPPIITNFPKKLKQGDFLILEGTSLPNYTILLLLQKERVDLPIIREVKVDNYGNWRYIHEVRVKEGIYNVLVKNKDERGVISEPTEKIIIPVILPPWLQIGNLAIDYLIIIITLILLIIGSCTIIFYTWYKISQWKNRLKKETKEASRAVTKTFQILKKEIQKQVEYFDNNPGLSDEEKEIRDKLQEILDASRKLLNKEVKDIEEELK